MSVERGNDCAFIEEGQLRIKRGRKNEERTKKERERRFGRPSLPCKKSQVITVRHACKIPML